MSLGYEVFHSDVNTVVVSTVMCCSLNWSLVVGVSRLSTLLSAEVVSA